MELRKRPRGNSGRRKKRKMKDVIFKIQSYV